MSVSVILITENAADTLERRRESVAWVDEIVVVDSAGNDRTVEIVRELGRECRGARGLVLAIAVGCLVNALLLDHTEGLLYAWLTGLLFGGYRPAGQT